MRKQIFGRRLKRDTNERKALFRSLMHGLVLHGKIKTTEAKAKAIRGEMEKLVTMAKEKGEEAKRILTSRLANEQVADKIIKEVAPLFKSRPGGYTRIIRLGTRVKDGAQTVLMTWVETVSVTNVAEPKRKSVKSETKPAKASKEVKKVEKPASKSKPAKK